MKRAKKTRPKFFHSTARYGLSDRLIAYAKRKDGKIIYWRRPQL